MINRKVALGNGLRGGLNVLLKPLVEHGCGVLCRSWAAGFAILLSAWVKVVVLAVDQAAGLQLWEVGVCSCRKHFLTCIFMFTMSLIFDGGAHGFHLPLSDQLLVSVSRTLEMKLMVDSKAGHCTSAGS